MTCPSELTYNIYVDGELSAEEARQVEAHVATCSRCRTLVEALRAEHRLLLDAFRERQEEELVPAKSRPLDILWTALTVVAVAAGLHLGVSWIQGVRSPVGGDWLDPFSLSAQLNLFFSAIFYFFQEGMAMLVSSITSIAGLVLTAVAIAAATVWLRRRSSAATVLAALVLVFLLVLPARALETRRAKGGAVTVAKGETIEDTLVVHAETVIVDGTITGNLFAFAERVEINGTVKGNVLSFAGLTPISGTVEGNAYCFTSRLELEGRVGQDLNAFAARTVVKPQGQVDGNLMAFTAEAELNGRAGQDVLAFAGGTNVGGRIGRNLIAHTGRLELRDPARVGGDVTAYVKKKSDIRISPGAQVSGRIDTHLPKAGPSRYAQFKFYFWQALWLVAAFLTGLLFYHLFPALFRSRPESAGTLLWRLLAGFAVGVLTLVAAIIAAVTVVGIPLAVMALASLALGLYLAKIIVAAWLGRALRSQPTERTSDFALSLLIGLLVLYVGINLPYVGGVLHFLVLLLGLGLVAVQLWNQWRQRRAEQPVA